jgi:hypothetical protein
MHPVGEVFVFAAVVTSVSFIHDDKGVEYRPLNLSAILQGGLDEILKKERY